MNGFGDVEAGSCPYLLKSDKDYQAGYGKRERRVMIDVSLHQQILAALSGSRGWSLTCPIPPLHLLADDRLQPSEYLRDVGFFIKCRIASVQPFFFRMDALEFPKRRVCPGLDCRWGACGSNETLGI